MYDFKLSVVLKTLKLRGIDKNEKISIKTHLDVFDGVSHPDSNYNVIKSCQRCPTPSHKERTYRFILINTTVNVPRKDKVLNNFLRGSTTDRTKVPGVTTVQSHLLALRQTVAFFFYMEKISLKYNGIIFGI